MLKNCVYTATCLFFIFNSALRRSTRQRKAPTNFAPATTLFEPDFADDLQDSAANTASIATRKRGGGRQTIDLVVPACYPPLAKVNSYS